MKTIVNADDFGYSISVNEAISKAFSQNLISQTTIMVNMAAFQEALERAKKEGLVNKIGLHINLTEGFSLTPGIRSNRKIVNADGTFNGSLINNQLFRFLLSKKDRSDIREEIDAQMKMYVSSGFTLMHLDSHHHIHNNFSLIFIIKKLALRYGFKSVRICRNMMSKKEFSLKRYYKIMLNFIIKNSFETVKYFGEYCSYEKNYPGNGNVEVMVHPDLINGEVVDVLERNGKCENLNSYIYYNTSTLLTYKD